MADPLIEEREISDYWKARAQAAERDLRLLSPEKWQYLQERDRWKERAEKEQAAGMAAATEAASWRNDAERLAARVRFHWARSGIVEDKETLAVHDALLRARISSSV